MFVWICLLAWTVVAKYNDKGCIKQIQSIVKGSETCEQNYFESINSELKKYSPLLFSSQAESVIANFEQQYGITITQSFFSASDATGVSGESCTNYVNSAQRYVNIDSTYHVSFPNTDGSTQNITSLSVSINSNTNTVMNLIIILSYFIAVPTPNSILLFAPNQCGSNGGLVATFQDGGYNPSNYCEDLRDGLTFAASGGSIQQSLLQASVYSNSPIYLSITASEAGGPLIFNSATLRICTAATGATPAYTYDVAKSNLNVPGFRYDSGMYYYTSIYRDNFGQMQYITISGAKSSVFC